MTPINFVSSKTLGASRWKSRLFTRTEKFCFSPSSSAITLSTQLTPGLPGPKACIIPLHILYTLLVLCSGNVYLVLCDAVKVSPLYGFSSTSQIYTQLGTEKEICIKKHLGFFFFLIKKKF